MKEFDPQKTVWLSASGLHAVNAHYSEVPSEGGLGQKALKTWVWAGASLGSLPAASTLW